MPLALRLSEGLGRTWHEPLEHECCGTVIIGAVTRQDHASLGQNALRDQIAWRHGCDDATQSMNGRAVGQQLRDCLCRQADTPVSAEEGVLDFWLRLPARVNQARKAHYGARVTLHEREHSVAALGVVGLCDLEPLLALALPNGLTVTDPSHCLGIGVDGKQWLKVLGDPVPAKQAL